MQYYTFKTLKLNLQKKATDYKANTHKFFSHEPDKRHVACISIIETY